MHNDMLFHFSAYYTGYKRNEFENKSIVGVCFFFTFILYAFCGNTVSDTNSVLKSFCTNSGIRDRNVAGFV